MEASRFGGDAAMGMYGLPLLIIKFDLELDAGCA